MKLGELAAAAECSVATVKYYVREGLLPPGTPVTATQADYDEHHLARLRMIRVLREVGNLAIADIGRVVEALENDTISLNAKLASAFYALPPRAPADEPSPEAVLEQIRAFAVRHGWQIAPDAPSVALLAHTVQAARRLWGPVGPEIFDRYADAFDALARGDVEVIADAPDAADVVRQVVVGTVLWDVALVALRRMAAEHYATQRWEPDSR